MEHLIKGKVLDVTRVLKNVCSREQLCLVSM